MSVKLSSQVWKWYGADEFTLVLRACNLGKALEFLALESKLQGESIPDCPACEVWSAHILRIHDSLESFRSIECSTLISHLDAIWAACNSLSDAAFHCHDRQIFSNSEWDFVRQHARAAIEEMGWVNLREHSDDLMAICRKATLA